MATGVGTSNREEGLCDDDEGLVFLVESMEQEGEGGRLSKKYLVSGCYCSFLFCGGRCPLSFFVRLMLGGKVKMKKCR